MFASIDQPAGRLDEVTAVACRISGFHRMSRSSEREPAGRVAVTGAATLVPLSPLASSGIVIAADDVSAIVPFDAVEGMFPSLRSCCMRVTDEELPAVPTAWKRIQATSPEPDRGVALKIEIAAVPGSVTDQLTSKVLE